MFADKPHRLNGRMRAAISCFDDLASGYRTRVGLPAQRAIAQRFRALALSGHHRRVGECLLLREERKSEVHRQHPSYAHLENLCQNRAEQDADLRPWKPVDVMEFHERLDRTPSNHRELADLAVLRLLDLKDDLEEGDDSIAAVDIFSRLGTIRHFWVSRDVANSMRPIARPAGTRG